MVLVVVVLRVCKTPGDPILDFRGMVWYGISKAESSGFTVRRDTDSLKRGSAVNTITYWNP